jgi:hypothetical protein
VLSGPTVLALNGTALVTALLMLVAAGFGLQVLRHWDIESGSELQLVLERRTYLIATLVAWCFVSAILSLLLFVHNAEQMSTQIVGAMCATGVLNASPWGWPALFLKIVVFLAGAAWLMLNRIDNQAPDYPLVRVKYGLLLGIAPLVLADAAVQIRFFMGLDPDVITSCCGALFTPEGEGIASRLSAVDPATSLVAMYASGLAVLGLGIRYRRRTRAAAAFSLAASLAFGSALAAVVSCIALYVYAHPHHHCPFCILKSGHGYVGYWLYIPLFAATALSLGIGLVSRWRRVPTLTDIIACDGKRFASVAMILFGVFYAVATYAVLRSNLTMRGLWW